MGHALALLESLGPSAEKSCHLDMHFYLPIFGAKTQRHYTTWGLGSISLVSNL